MPSPTKYHIFKPSTFQGLVYCDYCGKLLWGLARQGVQCTECNYSCHEKCSEMVVQCRASRRFSPDSLSVTDSEAESISKYPTSPRHSTDVQRTPLTVPNPHSPLLVDDGSSKSSVLKRLEHDRPKSIDVPTNLDSSILSSMRSPTSGAGSTQQQQQAQYNQQGIENPTQRPHTVFRTQSVPVKTYRKVLKQHVQNTIVTTGATGNGVLLDSKKEGGDHQVVVLNPQTTAKAFTRMQTDVRSGQAVSHVLLPRFDETSPEYYINLERMQQSMVFCIRIYDNLAYHLEHVSMTLTTFVVLLLIGGVLTPVALYFFFRWIVLVVGLVVLLNKTWIGSSVEAVGLFVLELLQTAIDVFLKLKSTKPPQNTIVEVSIYENQRWWAGSGFTSQLLRSERPGWSNITGSEPLPPKEDMPPPAHHVWDEEEWHLDLTGPWIDDVLDIGELIS
ncbi:hypothetical protein J3Q64DRAFT_1810975 [Phycomyces blakesleeanus]|uniref:Phorbol-ester/DAG-type domain-containing protein n=1 Tax=Phycomyces blakesleeanus TaxID=4837 RepID=A0ABR3ANG2_PHYBL